MASKSTASSGGIGLGGLLTVLFVGLKLTHYIDWSWWWVLCPMWIGIAFVFGLLALLLLFSMVVVALKK